MSRRFHGLGVRLHKIDRDMGACGSERGWLRSISLNIRNEISKVLIKVKLTQKPRATRGTFGHDCDSYILTAHHPQEMLTIQC